MTAANYDACEIHVLASEGGYTNDPKDPGGPTNWGITIYDARLYWKRDAGAADVKAMPRAVAEDIYRKKYWDALDCDALPAGLDYTVFDYGVNSGIARSGKVLRQCMGLPATDWHVTPDVIAALAKRDMPALIKEVNAQRLHFLQGLSTWPHFGKGWGARVASVEAISLHMAATGSIAPLSAPLPAAIVPHTATADAPSAKGVADAHDLVAQHAEQSGWQGLWTAISAALS